ncbi:MAG: hypothetical protein U0232_06865 [Thermomicrobiales bacterium]
MNARDGSPVSRALGWLPVALLLLALLPPLLKLPAAAQFATAILGYPFQVDDSEGVVLSEAQWLARGVDPYQPARADFFTAAPYTPIFTALNALAFAVGPFTFKVGRGIAFLATLLIAATLAALVRRGGGGWLLALWAGLTTLTINLVGVWAVRARPDHLALAFNLAGVALVYWRWEDAGGRKGRGAGGSGAGSGGCSGRWRGAARSGSSRSRRCWPRRWLIGICLLVRRWQRGSRSGCSTARWCCCHSDCSCW